MSPSEPKNSFTKLNDLINYNRKQQALFKDKVDANIENSRPGKKAFFDHIPALSRKGPVDQGSFIGHSQISPFRNFYGFSPVGPKSLPEPAPENQEETSLRLEVIFFCIQKPVRVLKAIFPNGQLVRNDKTRFVHGNIIVLIEGGAVAEINEELPPCGWYNKETLEYGYNLISLYSYAGAISYEIAQRGLADYYAEKIEKHKNKVPWWKQRIAPLRIINFTYKGFPGWECVSEIDYVTSAGIPFAKVMYWSKKYEETKEFEETKKEKIRIDYILMGHPNSENLHWVPVSAVKSYLLNLDQIENFKAHIIIESGERQASKRNSDAVVYTTCSCGLQKLVEADLKSLKERNITINLDSFASIPSNMAELIEKLKNIGIKKLNFNFDGKYLISYEMLLRDPGIWGFEGILNGIQPANHGLNFTPLGKASPNEDKDRPFILENLIKKGDFAVIYASPDTGKSWIVNYMAIALAKGNYPFIKWLSKGPFKVGVVDSELFEVDYDRRNNMIMAGMGIQDSADDPLFFYRFNVMDRETIKINIENPDVQKEIESEIHRHKIECIIFDSLSFLTTNNSMAFDNVLSWFYKLKKQGITVIAVDHDNKEGAVRGSRQKTRSADLVIKLEAIHEFDEKNYKKYPKFIKFLHSIGDMDDGLIIFKFEKGRHLHKDKKHPILLRTIFIKDTFGIEEVRQYINKEVSEITQKEKELANILFLNRAKNLTEDQIEDEIGMPKSSVGYNLRTAIPNYIKKHPDRESLIRQELERKIQDADLNAEADKIIAEIKQPIRPKRPKQKKLRN